MQTFARSQGCKRRSRNCLALLPIRGPVGKYRATDMLVTCRSQPLRGRKHGAFDPESRSVEFYAAEFNDLGPFGDFLSNEFSEIGRGAGERRKANIGEPRLDFSIGKSSVSIAKDNLPRFSATAARANGSFPYGT